MSSTFSGGPDEPTAETEARSGERVDQLDRPVHRREVLPDQVAIDGLLARVERLAGGVVEVGAPEARDDLAAGLPERGGELLLRDRQPVLATHEEPAPHVRVVGIDEHAVDVEDHGSPFPGHRAPSCPMRRPHATRCRFRLTGEVRAAYCGVGGGAAHEDVAPFRRRLRRGVADRRGTVRPRRRRRHGAVGRDHGVPVPRAADRRVGPRAAGRSDHGRAALGEPLLGSPPLPRHDRSGQRGVQLRPRRQPALRGHPDRRDGGGRRDHDVRHRVAPLPHNARMCPGGRSLHRRPHGSASHPVRRWNAGRRGRAVRRLQPDERRLLLVFLSARTGRCTLL